MPVSTAILTGTTEIHLAALPGSPIKVHKDMLKPFLAMQSAAAQEGFQLEVVSGFRGFEAQQRIWNAKARGERPLLDGEGKPLNFSTLSSEAIVHAILRWSALPGASRHHWGTEVDVVDRGAIPAGYRVQLIPEEVAEDGIFGPLHSWLDKHKMHFGFYRPYDEDRGGVSPERWHLSYGPRSGEYYEAYTLELLKGFLQGVDLELKAQVLKDLPGIYQRYIRNIRLP